MRIHALTWTQRQSDRFGVDACEYRPAALGVALLDGVVARGDFFGSPGSSPSSSTNTQSTSDDDVATESGLVVQDGSVASQEGDAIASSTVAEEEGLVAQSSNVATDEAVTANSSNVATQGSTQFQNISGGVTIGLTGEQLTDLVQEQAERTGDTISVALESQGTALESSLDKLAATTAASQTGGASILTKQFGWIIAGVLAFLAVVLIWGGKRK